jgi:hypothetical protein
MNQEDLGKTFKLKELKARPDWNMWQQARYKMLDDYSSQDMFSDPMMEPKGAPAKRVWSVTGRHGREPSPWGMPLQTA